ncbi:tyrosine/serine/threonine protein phosphatase pps1 [Savitreella phatthalungensis]
MLALDNRSFPTPTYTPRSSQNPAPVNAATPSTAAISTADRDGVLSSGSTSTARPLSSSNAASKSQVRHIQPGPPDKAVQAACVHTSAMDFRVPPFSSVSRSPLTRLSDYPECLPGIHRITAAQLSHALDVQARSALPPSQDMFPWLHGVKETPGGSQWQFFVSQHGRTEAKPPASARFTIIIHADPQEVEEPDVFDGKLKGAFRPQDILSNDPAEPGFLRGHPRTGINLRNFAVQPALSAVTADIIVYDHRCDGRQPTIAAVQVAERTRDAQELVRQEWPHLPKYSTFLLTDDWHEIASPRFTNLVSIEAAGTQCSYIDFVRNERQEMNQMSRYTEIARNVFLGTDEDWNDMTTCVQEDPCLIHIRCEDYAKIPSIDDLTVELREGDMLEVTMPSSGSVQRYTGKALAAVVDACSWIYANANGTELSVRTPDDRGQRIYQPQQRKVLITCRDGYTETTFLALAYIIFAHCLRPDQAWLYLHRVAKREFYAFPEDVSSITHAAEALIRASPEDDAAKDRALHTPLSSWFGHPDRLADLARKSSTAQTVEAQRQSKRMSSTSSPLFTGSFPSRILPHLYLGNLEHANNVWMLRELEIGAVLSLGEAPSYTCARAEDGDKQANLPHRHKYVDDLQDDGVDSLLSELESCLDFIERARAGNMAVLVHCRVGVSRSASVCIAEVARRLDLDLPSAYIYVRARRLNVIIQPNLLFMYELLLWTQHDASRRRRLKQQSDRDQRTAHAASLPNTSVPQQSSSLPTYTRADSLSDQSAAVSSYASSTTSSLRCGSGPDEMDRGIVNRGDSGRGIAMDDGDEITTDDDGDSMMRPRHFFHATENLVSSPDTAHTIGTSFSPASPPVQFTHQITGSPNPESTVEHDNLVPRTIEWPELCASIAKLNRLYIQQAQ